MTRTHGAPHAVVPRVDDEDERAALRLNPRLYLQIEKEPHISFDHVVKAFLFGHPSPDGASNCADGDRMRASVYLEDRARTKFGMEHGGIRKDYWSLKPSAGCALTGDYQVHSFMNIDDPELVLYEDQIHQVSRDAYRTFEVAGRRRGGKAERDLAEIGEMLYSVLARVIGTARVLADEKADQRKRDDAVAAARAEWKLVRASVEEMIQRQARFEYFEGVGLGALLTIPALAVVGWLAVHYGTDELSEPGEPGSFAAAIIGGATGAVISVTQRMTTRAKPALMLDFTAPKAQKVALGALRPLVGAVFGAVIYFAITGGLLAVNAKTGQDASVALAFFAVTGFGAGFSERLATDVLTRVNAKVLPPGPGELGAENPDELTLLLSEQARHAAAPPERPERKQDSQGAAGAKRKPWWRRR